ncbi:MAG: hypothetical protein EZS28_025312 [Streblomastix strix]|uniref:Reverse transcriptase domain-containing protein n=1 Tax=Streblomastix strix TaxID=222440 RepID=A0A5J4V9S3_9EUKA|nr:MAG: hypothetical protein EZS28_025312 [Streblomastix strix]
MDQWDKIGSIQTIIRGAQPEWISPAAPLILLPQQQPRQFRGTLEQEKEYMNQLEKELSSGVVKEMDNVQVYNPTFLVPRQDGQLRKILDCRKINLLTQLTHFKMYGPEELRQILQESNYATILDIKNAFYHVRVSPNLQPFQRFQFKKKAYTYLGLPFCWRRSPLLFSRTLSIAIRSIREKWNVKIQNYMDNKIFVNQSKQQHKQLNQKNITFISNRSRRLSPTKCVTIPKKCFQYLSWSFQTQSIEVTMTQTRRRSMKHNLKDWFQMTNESQIVTIRSLDQKIGEINYLRFQFPKISLWMNAINNLKTRAIAKGGWDASVKLYKQILGNLWTILILIKQIKLRQVKDRTPDLILQTHANKNGRSQLCKTSNGKQWTLING